VVPEVFLDLLDIGPLYWYPSDDGDVIWRIVGELLRIKEHQRGATHGATLRSSSRGGRNDPV